MESVPQPAADNRLARIATAIAAGLFAATVDVALFTVLGMVIFAYFVNTVSFESGGTIALAVDLLCVAPLALLTAIPVGVITGRIVSGRLALVASEQGRPAQRKAARAIAGGIGLSIVLVVAGFLAYPMLPVIPRPEREVLAQLGIRPTRQSPCRQKNIACSGFVFRAHVTEVKITRRSITSLPPDIARLSHLKVLDLSANKLRSIPPEISRLSRLEVLTLYRNQLSQIPPELGALPSLKSLRLDNNQLTAIPPELGNLSSLQTLYLNDNRLGGPIPPELGNLSNLKALKLENNRLGGPIPPELGRLSNLTWLDLSGNQLSGPLPPELSALSELDILRFANTGVCEPQDPTLQAWLSGIRHLSRTNLPCP